MQERERTRPGQGETDTQQPTTPEQSEIGKQGGQAEIGTPGSGEREREKKSGGTQPNR
jgi:hypothetical protein